MDKKTEKSGHQKILRRVSNRLKEIGFEKHKTVFFIRPGNKIIQFIHLHKFTYGPEYRVHLGIRVWNDDKTFFHLNGINSHPYQCKNSPNGKRYNFRFHKTEETIERCVGAVFQFCAEVGEPWFEEWSEQEKLLSSPLSPLNAQEKELLKTSLA